MDTQTALEISSLFSKYEPKIYIKNDKVLQPHQITQHIYHLDHGLACSFTHGENGDIRILKTYYPHDIFPLTEISESHNAAVGILAVSDIKIRQIPKQIFNKQISYDLPAAQNMISYLTKLHNKTITENEFMQNKSANERLMYRLSLLARHFGKPSVHGIIIDITISNTYLARSTNMARETASRQMSLLIRKNEVSIMGGNICLKAPFFTHYNIACGKDLIII